MKRSRPVVLGLGVVLVVAVTARAENWTPVATTGTSTMIEEPTRLNALDPIFQQIFLPDQDQDVVLTSVAQLFSVNPQFFDINNARKGRARVTANCQTPNGQRNLGSRQVRADPDSGVLVYNRTVPANLNCDFFILQWAWLRNLKLPAGNSIQIDTIAELLDPAAPDFCEDPTTLCLNEDRFQTGVSWRNSPSGPSRPAVGFAESDDSGTFYFFNRTNGNAVVKVIDGCAFNDHFWVFAAAATDVEWEVTVTDTQTQSSRTYGNALGQPAPAVVDTQAFATCP